MRKVIALLVLAAFLSGCTGSFVLTKKVYEFHRSMDNKWADEALFAVCAYLPVYIIAMLGDAIIFNTVEFWTESNPLSAGKPDRNIRVAHSGKYKAVMSHDARTDTVTVNVLESDIPVTSFVLARGADGVTVKDLRGDVLMTAAKDIDGGVSLYSRDRKMVRHFSADAVSIAKERTGTGTLVAQK
ncbi:MAG: DUF3332 family protein [Candidatus Omnitrophica bacterium]|nr:DUF3332 family protein [Candidatus Omnitrophota bacterium]